MGYMTLPTRDYQGAVEYLQGAKDGHSRPVANNTRVRWAGDDFAAIRLHSTDVVVYRADGAQFVHMGGWPTVTTRDRINTYSAARVHSHKGTQYISHPSDPLSPVRVQRCRTCKGSGKRAGECWGPRHVDCWPGGVGAMARASEPCEHGETMPHATVPCEHGEARPWARHPAGWAPCFRCEGEGERDYGSRPQPTEVDPWAWVRVDSTGRVLDVAAEAPELAPFQGVKPMQWAPSLATAYAPIPDAGTGERVMRELTAAVPALAVERVECPDLCTPEAVPVSQTIIHLNDAHGWTREGIADWLDTLDLDLTFTPDA